MRRLIIGLFLAGVAAGACNRTPNNTAATPETAQPGSIQPGAAPVPTTGAGEPARDKSSLVARDQSPVRQAAPRPTVREVTIPAGTELPVVLDTSLGSKTSHVEEPVRAHLSRPITVGGEQVLPDGSSVSGVVTAATPSARVKGRAHLAVRFDSITPRGGDERYRIETGAIARTAPAEKKKDALKIGAPAAGGAIIGALVGGGKGAAIGAAAGGGAGTAVVLSTRGKETSLPAGTPLRLRLAAPLTIRVRG
jgi:hypothetical protein